MVLATGELPFHLVRFGLAAIGVSNLLRERDDEINLRAGQVSQIHVAVHRNLAATGTV